MLEANGIQPSNHSAIQRGGHDGPVGPGASAHGKSIRDFPEHLDTLFSIEGVREADIATPFAPSAFHASGALKPRLSQWDRIPAFR